MMVKRDQNCCNKTDFLFLLEFNRFIIHQSKTVCCVKKRVNMIQALHEIVGHSQYCLVDVDNAKGGSYCWQIAGQSMKMLDLSLTITYIHTFFTGLTSNSTTIHQ
jgi:hypothetical protein